MSIALDATSVCKGTQYAKVSEGKCDKDHAFTLITQNKGHDSLRIGFLEQSITELFL